jgi:hypothetical protein
VTDATLCPIGLDIHPTTVHGVATTHQNAWEGQVFRRIGAPACRLVSLWPDAKAAFKAWLGQALLPWEFRGMLKMWPVEADLSAAIVINTATGFEPWRAQVCLNGLLDRNPASVLAVAELLEDAAGIVVPSPSRRLTLIVREDSFGSSVSIEAPRLIRGQGDHSRARR